MNKSDLIRRYKSIQQRQELLYENMECNSQEETRIVNVLANSQEILNELDFIFEKRTSLSKTDTSFLFVAIALQLVRIYMLPGFQEKFKDEDRLAHDDASIKQMEKNEINKHKSEYQSTNKWKTKESAKGYKTWQEIAYTIKVPYDMTKHSGEGFNNINMHGGQHRVKALGHDPILGWVFGVANIITDTITIAPEYKLGEKKIRISMVKSFEVTNNCWNNPIPTFTVFSNAFESIREDHHRLSAAVFAQGLHLASDKWTKMGLPIPLLGFLDQDKAYEVYTKQYDLLDLEYDMQILTRSTKSAMLSMLINKIISSIHTLFYNPEKEPNREFYAVRTRKILLYSNLIATSSDIIQTAIRASSGDANAVKNFDIGGLLVTLYRLSSDTDFILKIKEEFIYSEWDKIMESKDNFFNI